MLAIQIPSEPLNRMNPRCKVGLWLGVRNNGAECFVETAVRRMEHQKQRLDKEAINNMIGAPAVLGSSSAKGENHQNRH